jgi:CheY-like chemotaxis protein
LLSNINLKINRLALEVMPTDLKNDNFNLKVLIVDDNDSIRVILGEMLKIYSSEIIFADNGNEAVAAIENFPDIDLILMDVYMHNMDGFEATKRIRQINKKVIIFVMTAAALSELVEDFSGTRINDYFPKPFNKEYLGKLIKKHFT